MTLSHGVRLAEDRKSVTLHITEDKQTLTAKLDLTDLDLLIDTLAELREQIAARTGDGK